MLGKIWTVLRTSWPGSRDTNQQSTPLESGNASDLDNVEQVIAGGSGNLQVGVAHGDVVSSVSHLTQHTHYVTVIQTSASEGGNTRKPSSSEQSAVLRRLDQLRDRARVLDFMDREFGSRMVIHLTPEQLYRLNRYLDVVLRDPRNIKRPFTKHKTT